MKIACCLLVVLALGGAGCKKKDSKATTPTAAPVTQPTQEVTFHSITVDAGLIRLKPGISIKFEVGSDVLLDESKPTLDEVSTAMKQQPRMRLRVEGHTDSDGDDQANIELSTRRAAAVKAYLEGQGIEATRVESLGCGEASPLADNASDAGKQQNRRVEFVIVGKGWTIPTCQVYKPST